MKPSRVYLRVCGGTHAGRDVVSPAPGLSPRVRRHHPEREVEAFRRGSISACAEAPGTGRSPHTGRRVYLRVCGGTRTAKHPFRQERGLSPRVRRHHVSVMTFIDEEGSISACAEAPGSSRWLGAARGVYLRVCGGTMLLCSSMRFFPGLSPRVRRHPRRRLRLRRRPRSISACAEAPSRGSWRGWRRGVYLRVCGGTYLGRHSTSGKLGLSPRVRRHPTGPLRRVA